MNRMSGWLLMMLAAVMLTTAVQAQEVIPVAPGVPDGEPCEPKAPQEVPCNLASAIKLAVPGTRLELAGGTYGCVDVAGLHGTPAMPIVFAAAADAAVTVACADPSFPATITVRDSWDLAFRGLTIVNMAGRPLVAVMNSPAVSFEQCTYGDGATWTVGSGKGGQ